MTDDLGELLAWVESPHAANAVRTLEDSAARAKRWAAATYGKLAADVRLLAAGLRAHRLAPGDRVCVLCAPGPAFIGALYAAWWAGGCGVPLPLPVMSEPPARYWSRIESMIAVARPRLIMVSAAQLADPQGAPLAGLARAAGADVVTLAALCAAGHDGPLGRVRGTGTALVQFTSGSGGPPKGVPVSAANLSANVAALRRWLGITETDRTATWLPHYHDMGLTGCVLVPVTAQGDIFVMRPEQFIRDPVAWLSCFGEHGATMTASPSFGYQYAAARTHPERLRGMDFAPWRVAVVGAERVSPRAIAGFAGLLAPFRFDAGAFRPAYGLAEATLAVTGRHPEDCFTALDVDWEAAERGRKVPVTAEHQLTAFGREGSRPWVVSCGRPLAGVDVTIVDDDHRELPEGTLGEVAVSGASVTRGYLGAEPESVFTSFVGARLFTGDDGFIWNGQLYVVGRRGDGLKVAGRSLYSEQVEAEFAVAAGLSPSRCTALLGTLGGTEEAAVIVEAPVGEWVAAASAVLTRLTGGIRHAVYTAPRGTVPRTTSGKPMRKAAWKLLAAGDLNITCVQRKDRE